MLIVSLRILLRDMLIRRAELCGNVRRIPRIRVVFAQATWQRVYGHGRMRHSQCLVDSSSSSLVFPRLTFSCALGTLP